MNNCRCCGKIINTEPCISYENMPAKAQNFPSQTELEMDKGINLCIYQCPYCGLIQLLDEPVGYFRDVIRAVAVSEEMKNFRKEYFQEFISFCQLENKRIIEIGAGSGEYMEMIQENNVDVFGLEHLKSSVIRAKEKGLTVFEGFVENSHYVIPHAPYDGFYIMNFLEHIPEPGVFLQGIANNLSTQAYGLIEVPNSNSIIEKHMISEFMLDHLSYFTESTLRNILEINGFEVVRCELTWHDSIISAVVRKRKGFPTEEFKRDHDRQLNVIFEFLEEMEKKNKKIAIWGAGHQALALMALGNLQNRVECVIDSAEFKQNRFTPATHIPIYGPEYISKLGIEAIMIMTGSYSEEVNNIIRDNYQNVEAKIVL